MTHNTECDQMQILIQICELNLNFSSYGQHYCKYIRERSTDLTTDLRKFFVIDVKCVSLEAATRCSAVLPSVLSVLQLGIPPYVHLATSEM